MKFNVVGKDIARVDALSKVTGKALYPGDIYMDNMAYGKTLRSKMPHAYIKGINIQKAKQIDGVIKIFTHEDVPNNEHGVVFKDHQVFCSDKVRRIGDPIAFVVAESNNVCELALKEIEVEYEEIEGVFDPLEAMEEDSPKVHGDTNIVYHYKLRKGNVENSFKDCYIVVENTYKTHMVDQVFLQPEAGVSFIDDEGRVAVMVATQYPHYDREEVALALNMPEEQIRIINTNIGGAFGGREDISLQIHLALAAKVLNRPVKTVYTREESFVGHAKRHPVIMRYKTGADKDGKLMAMEAEIIGDTGAYASWATNVLRKSGVHATGPYYIPNVKVDSIAVYTNNPYAGAMRGFGATQVPIAYEQQMDMLAEKLDMDPIEIRMINALKKGSVTATGQVLTDSVPIKECIDGVTQRMNFKASSESKNRHKGRGIGLSYYGTGYGNGFPDISRAKVKLLRDGKVGIYVGGTEVGQGAKTALTQIGAEALNITIDNIEFITDDTSIMPDSGTAAASRQTYNTGNAIKLACEDFIEKLKKAAKDELKLNATHGLIVEKGQIYLEFFPQKNISFKKLSGIYGEGNIIGEGEFTAQTVEMDPETGQGVPYWPYTFNACGIELEVDVKTGLIEITKAVFAQDVGRAVNPHLIEGQMDGGFAMALGYVLFEDLKLDKGRIINNKYSRYLIPTAMDMFEIEKIIVEDPEPTAPFGAKGIGEPVMIPIAPAILNAIYNATGVRITELPATPERLIKAIEMDRKRREEM